MALMDMIARSGGANFETMRKGWLPNPEEKASRRMAELQAQRQEQIIDAEPQRRKLADLSLESTELGIDLTKQKIKEYPATQKRVKEKHTAEMKAQGQRTEKFDKEMSTYKTEEELLTKERNHAVTSKYIQGAMNRYKETGDIYEAKKIIRENYQTIIDAGDDGTDRSVDRFLSSAISEDEAISTLSNVHAIIPEVQTAIDKRRLQSMKGRSGTNSAIAERYAARIAAGETLTAQEWNHYNKLTNTTPTKSSEINLKAKTVEHKEKALIKSRETATAAMKRVVERNKTIDEAIQSMDSGNNALSDKLLTSKLLNLSDTNVRAFAIYKELDVSFGNLFERAVDIVGQVAFGQRTERQNEIIRETLTKMKKLSGPVLKTMRRQNRALAKADGHDPFRVVPPVSAIDIADSKLIDRKAKEKLFEQYPQFMEEILNEAK